MSAALLAPVLGGAEPNAGTATEAVFVTLSVGGQLCGLAVQHVRDVLGPQTITRIPLAPPEVAGNLNLRGRIVTAISLRQRLGLPPLDEGTPSMSVVTEQGAELYALLVDQVLEVSTFPAEGMRLTPPTLSPAWKRLSAGMHCLAERLIVILNLGRVLDLTSVET